MRQYSADYGKMWQFTSKTDKICHIQCTSNPRLSDDRPQLDAVKSMALNWRYHGTYHRHLAGTKRNMFVLSPVPSTILLTLQVQTIAPVAITGVKITNRSSAVMPETPVLFSLISTEIKPLEVIVMLSMYFVTTFACPACSRLTGSVELAQ
mgnify:CR=1 FL=1